MAVVCSVVLNMSGVVCTRATLRMPCGTGALSLFSFLVAFCSSSIVIERSLPPYGIGGNSTGSCLSVDYNTVIIPPLSVCNNWFIIGANSIKKLTSLKEEAGQTEEACVKF